MLYNCLVWSAKGHSTIVNAIDGIGGNTPNSQEGAPLIATGSRDGTVKVRKLFCLNTAVGKLFGDSEFLWQYIIILK